MELTRDINLSNEVIIAESLEEAKLLIPAADVIFLDVRHPGETRRWLEGLRADGALDSKKLIIMANSETDLAMLREMGLEADGYVTEPLDIFQLASVMYQVKSIHFYLAIESATHD